MDKVYIISRYRADTKQKIEFNREVARYFCRAVIDEGKVPVAPHLFYTQFLDDDYPDDREIGLDMGLMELRESKEFLLVVIDGVISDGMRGEIAEAGRMCLPGRIVSMTHQEVAEVMKVVR